MFDDKMIDILANLKTRKFRNILSVLSKGLHLNEAKTIIAKRFALKQEILVDDLNTILNSCAFMDVKYAVSASLIRINKKRES